MDIWDDWEGLDGNPEAITLGSDDEFSDLEEMAEEEEEKELHNEEMEVERESEERGERETSK